MEPKKLYSIKMTLKPEDIMTFVSGLHNVQADMIEEVVAIKEKEGFPEARQVIDDIIANKGKYGITRPGTNGEIK